MVSGTIVEDRCFYCNNAVYEDEWVIDESLKDERFLVHEECMKTFNNSQYELERKSLEQVIRECFDVGVFQNKP
ncbi:hypothetical protein [Listeria booriae]|uniref:hypothetical protein n=1 Tax=Listeria booriae TaxID=1552123 RepID=UPI0016282623|nr:hypothetical protein [Listeria booriae]MBC1228635.1 hypothetical protein [Listeria booriae]MBC1248097.1 hypothetical protein [Listeria booriae]